MSDNEQYRDQKHLVGSIASKINEYGVGTREFSIAIAQNVFQFLKRNGQLTMHPSEDYSFKTPQTVTNNIVNRIEQLERRLDDLQASFDGIVAGALHSIKTAVNDMIGENYIAKADHEKRISELLESNTKLHHQNVGLLDRIAYLDKQIVELLRIIEDSSRTNELLIKRNNELCSELLKVRTSYQAMNKATED